MAKKKITDIETAPEDRRSYSIHIQNPRNLNNLYTTEFSGLDPNKIHYYLNAARKGLNFWKSLLFEEIRRRDLRIGAVCQTRKFGVVNKEWDINYDAESSVPESEQKKIRELIDLSIENINFANLISDIVEAQIQGVSTFELLYGLDGSNVVLEEACYIPNYLLLFDDRINEYSYLNYLKTDAFNLRTLGWNTMEDRVNIEPLKIPNVSPEKILEVHSLDGNAQNGFLNGCIDSLIWAYLFKNYGLKDWSAYVERFATPGVIGKYPPLMNTNDKRTFFDAVRNYGNNYKLTIPEACNISLLDDAGKGTTKLLFENYIDYWDKNISIRVLGQSLTTDIGDTGSRAASETHDHVREDIIVADMILVTQTVNDLIRRISVLNGIAPDKSPRFKFKEVEDVNNKKINSEILVNLKNAGWQVTEETINDKFGLEVVPVNDSYAVNSDTEKYIQKYIEEFEDGIYR